MRIADAIEYTAPVNDVFDMLTTDAFQESKCRATGALNHHVSIQRNGDSATILTKRTVPTTKFPDFVKSLVGDTLLIVQRDVWRPPSGDGSRAGTIHVEVEGTPIHLEGHLRLTPTSSGCREDIDGDMKCSIPLLGGRIEKAALPAVESAIQAERRVGYEWLSKV